MLEITQQIVTPDLKKQILEGFAHHAIEETGIDGNSEPFAFVAEDNGQFIGAVIATIFWGGLHIKYLYVGKEFRKQRIGSLLLEKAHEFGRQQKAPFAFVETMSFQALDFYKICGYQLEFTRPGYSHGTSFHYLKKELL